MEFSKKALSISDQILLLKERGLSFEGSIDAEHYLHHISYYRLSAYFYTFLEKPQKEHRFREGATFGKVIDTYVFDRKLKLLLFDEIERIEIALRTQLIFHYCRQYGNNWYENKALYKKPDQYYKFQTLLMNEMNRSSEVFIRHYKETYTKPPNPPAWMTLELASFGQLSLLYKNLKNCDARKAIADHFGVHENILASGLESLSFTRNVCAHHMRLWNRKLPKAPIIPTHTMHSFIEHLPADDKRNRIYINLVIIRYLLQIIVPKSSFSQRLRSLVDCYPDIPISFMGFPEPWREEKIWQS